MKRNVEIKAKVADLGAVRRVVEGLADSGPMELEQEDTFFVCPRGRLKLQAIRRLHAGGADLL